MIENQHNLTFKLKLKHLLTNFFFFYPNRVYQLEKFLMPFDLWKYLQQNVEFTDCYPPSPLQIKRAR